MPLILITHDVEDVKAFSEETLCLKDGQIDAQRQQVIAQQQSSAAELAAKRHNALAQGDWLLS